MAFEDDEVSPSRAKPIELFKFVGNYKTYRLTSYHKDITTSDGTYEAATVQRSNLEGGTQEDSSVRMVIEIPFKHEMVVDYAYNESPPSLYMTLHRIHPSDYEDQLLQWQGQVLSWAVEDRIAKLQVPSLFGYVFNGPLPPIKYQSPCNHVLYDEYCGLDSTPYTHSTTITSISQNLIGLSSNPFVDGACNGGEMVYEVGGERRMIISNSGTLFTVATPFAGLEVGHTVSVRQGCDHTFNGDCINKFNNGRRFGGCPLVPSRNPFSSRL